nr:hypothetical protein [Tanacetum cinerariifolium]
MPPLPPKDQRHSWLRYQVEGYTEDIMHNYEQILETIFGRLVNRVYKLDFARLTEGMRQTLAGRLRMVYTRVMDMSCSLVMHRGDCLNPWAVILTLGLHTNEEMAEDGFEAYWLGNPMRRLCHRMIACNISGRRQAPEKRKSGARLFRGHFIGRLAAHFSLVSDEGLRGLSVINHELLIIDFHELVRLNICERFGNTTRAGTPATSSYYVLEISEGRGGGARVTTKHYRNTWRCRQIDH